MPRLGGGRGSCEGTKGKKRIVAVHTKRGGSWGPGKSGRISLSGKEKGLLICCPVPRGERGNSRREEGKVQKGGEKKAGLVLERGSGA